MTVMFILVALTVGCVEGCTRTGNRSFYTGCVFRVYRLGLLSHGLDDHAVKGKWTRRGTWTRCHVAAKVPTTRDMMEHVSGLWVLCFAGMESQTPGQGILPSSKHCK